MKIRNIEAKHFSSIQYPILVNSYGRSGSTMLFKSIAYFSMQANNLFLRSLFQGNMSSVWDLNQSDPVKRFIYKTHDYPSEKSFTMPPRMVYVFADPVDVALSFLKLYESEKWDKKRIREHCQHLKVSDCNPKDVIYRDLLHLEDHFDSWKQEERFPVAFVRYDSIWKQRGNLSDFLGFSLSLPEFQKREAKNTCKNNGRCNAIQKEPNMILMKFFYNCCY